MRNGLTTSIGGVSVNNTAAIDGVCCASTGGTCCGWNLLRRVDELGADAAADERLGHVAGDAIRNTNHHRKGNSDKKGLKDEQQAKRTVAVGGSYGGAS